MNNEIRIAVASHKPYWMPRDQMYVPVQAGAAKNDPIPGFRRDDECDGGISVLNPRLSELTVLYWAWKNLDADAIGLTHYRRQFAGSGERGTLTSSEAALLLESAPVIVPCKRNYIIERVGDHYDHTFQPEYLDLLINTVAELSPKSSCSLYRCLSGSRAHMFNMMLMRKDLFDAYCEWMFPIVSSIEESIDYTSLTPFEERMPGRLSEFLLDTWLTTEKIPFAERPVQEMEPVNWVKKGSKFVAAKFLGKKYTRSF